MRDVSLFVCIPDTDCLLHLLFVFFFVLFPCALFRNREEQSPAWKEKKTFSECERVAIWTEAVTMCSQPHLRRQQQQAELTHTHTMAEVCWKVLFCRLFYFFNSSSCFVFIWNRLFFCFFLVATHKNCDCVYGLFVKWSGLWRKKYKKSTAEEEAENRPRGMGIFSLSFCMFKRMEQWQTSYFKIGANNCEGEFWRQLRFFLFLFFLIRLVNQFVEFGFCLRN